VWSFAFGWTIRDGDYALPGGAGQPGASGTAFVFGGSDVYVRDGISGLWVRWNNPGFVMVGATIPACTAPPPPQSSRPPAPTSTITVTGCSVKLTAAKSDQPDQTTGWRAQFRIDGKNVDTYDASAPYGPRTKALTPGTHNKDIVWSKSSSAVPTVTSTLGTVTCP
jgi:hypothetical protein